MDSSLYFRVIITVTFPHHYIQLLPLNSVTGYGNTYSQVFREKKKVMGVREPQRIFFPEKLWPFMTDPTKKIRIIQSLALKIFSVEVLHYFRLRCHDQRRRGPVLDQKAPFSDASSTPTSSSDIITLTSKKNHQFSELIILGRVWRKLSLLDKEGWCLEVSHEDF